MLCFATLFTSELLKWLEDGELSTGRVFSRQFAHFKGSLLKYVTTTTTTTTTYRSSHTSLALDVKRNMKAETAITTFPSSAAASAAVIGRQEKTEDNM